MSRVLPSPGRMGTGRRSIQSPLRVMQVINSLEHGGSERLACDLSLRFDPSRVRASVCALDVGGTLAETLRRATIPFYVAGCTPPGLDWRSLRRLYLLFREQRIDVVQTHHVKQLLYGGVTARLAGTVLVHVEHEYFSLKQARPRWGLRLLAPLCHRVVAVGEEVREFLLRSVGLPARKVVVIPNGVDTARYSPEQRVDRERLGLRRQGRLIGHVARLEDEKDQPTLLRAFRLVLDTCPETRLVIVGDGSRRGDLEQVARELGIAAHVDFLGRRDDVADLLPHLDVFVLSSLNEGLPLALLEAMACRRPVVATAIGEIPRVVYNGINGVTVPPGDSTALAVSVAAILQRPAWAAAMGQAARQLMEDRFSLAAAVLQYQTLYDSLLDGHRPAAAANGNAR